MARTVAIGIQSFDKIIEGNCFYIDKTAFIKEWWESKDDVTLIARPRRFGKTLNMSMLETFFSVDYAGRGDLFEGLFIWGEEEYRALQGTYPVISLSFANIKERNYTDTREKICRLLTNLYVKYSFLKDSDVMTDADRAYFDRVLSTEMRDSDATLALYQLSDYLQRYYGKKVIILLDEYDTPMQEAYVQGYWEDLVAFTRSLFNATFKTNPYMQRSIMTGITRVSKESIFSDLNNLKVVTTTSNEYATAFGFTEEEVFAGLDECGLSDEKQQVKWWYDGFIFGNHADIYNPWSVLNFLDTGKYGTYWANTSGNSLVGRLIRQGDRRIKVTFERLLKGETIRCPIDEQIVYNQLDDNDAAIWSLLLASGYLKVLDYERMELLGDEDPLYDLTLTNHEVRRMFYSMVRGWFAKAGADYNDFVKALLRGNIKEMNAYMNRVALQTFSYFDTGKNPSETEPERLVSCYDCKGVANDPSLSEYSNLQAKTSASHFYHGFVLGLIAEIGKDYVISSNRESGFGRYDVMIEPKSLEKDAIILEFKVHEQEEEETLKETLQAAHDQIEEKQYEATLIAKGFQEERIHKYGFAFEGKKVLIG